MAVTKIVFFTTSLCFVVVIVDSKCSEVANCVNCNISYNKFKCTQCEERYYINHNASCSACQNNCVTCVSFANCSGCLTGYYGTWCSLQCDPNCIQSECFQFNGTCVHGCPVGYYHVGPRCYKCNIPNCEECSDYQQCTRCTSGYNLWPSIIDTTCNVGCPLGTWGNTCQYNCSSNCFDTRCNKTNGHCYRCTRYTFGETCQFLCSEGCNDSTGTDVCVQQTGQCLYGCKPEYSGIICEKIRDTQCEAADDDDDVASVVGGVFGGTAVGFVGGLLLGYCIYKRKCWRRGQKSSKHDNTLTPPTVTYVNITETNDEVPVPGIQCDVSAYESLDRQSGPDQVYTGLKTGTR